MYILYGKGSCSTRLFAAKIEFDRSFSGIEKVMDNIRTVAFPNTVRYVSDNAFQFASVKFVILNEGLETLGNYRDKNVDSCSGVFSHT